MKIKIEEIIDGRSFLTIIKDKLIIKIDYTQEYDDFYKTIVVAYSPILVIFLISSIFSLYALIILFNFTICFLPVICIHTYYRYRKYEWCFDKSLKKILLQRVSTSLKRKRSYDLSKIDSISYQLGNYVFGPLYDLKIFLKYKKKGIKIYVGEKEKCERVGGLISGFLERPLNYDDSKELKIYWE